MHGPAASVWSLQLQVLKLSLVDGVLSRTPKPRMMQRIKAELRGFFLSESQLSQLIGSQHPGRTQVRLTMGPSRTQKERTSSIDRGCCDPQEW